MRIFDKSRRIKLSGISDEELFSPELEYYRSHNQYPVVLFGKPIVNIYKNINLQVLVTKACNYRCPFCIENDGQPSEINRGKNWIPYLVRETLQEYKNQGVTPTISITGGEPTLFPDRLFNVLDIIGSFGIPRVNLNTNGTNLQIPTSFPWLKINLSRHHYLVNANKKIFGEQYDPTNEPKDYTPFTLQCVLMKDYIHSIPGIINYIDHFSRKGAKGFSFRGLSTLDDNKGYQQERAFTLDQSLNIKPILDEIATDERFEFVQQKIGDHYIYEFYKYDDRFLRFTYSNFSWLRAVESKERENGQWFSRATIIHPDSVYTGWTYDINRIKKL